MSTADRISSFFSKLVQSVISVVKILLLSKFKTSKITVATSEELVILGNGPSLNMTLTDSMDFIDSKRLLAVNFAANTDQFLTLKPEYYVLADPHFFRGLDQQNVMNLWKVISEKVDWNLILFIPTSVSIKSKFIEDARANTHITIMRYNTTAVEGFNWLENICFKNGLGSPRPRNVLIPSLMIALRMNFKTIYIAGADHSWTRTISVNDNNEVVSIQPHFYNEEKAESSRVKTEYMKYPLHSILYSFYVAFKSYFVIKRFADVVGAKIWNITPDSFIDAFPRKKI